MDKIAIIVPMYKVEKYVKKCLESLINQSYKNIEIYAISDGSPDKSFEIAKRISKKDKRIICINKENGGYGSVLEYAINVINTNYFLICDPDDWLEPNAIETLYNEASKKKLDIVVADKYIVYDESGEKEYCPSSTSFHPIDSNYVEKKYVGKFSFLKVSPHAKLYKTSIAKKISFAHKCSYTDFTLYLCALNNSKSVEYIDVPLAYYLIDRPGNTATDFSIKAINNHIKVWESTYEQLKGTSDNYLIYRLYDEYKMIVKLYLEYRKTNRKEKETSINLMKIKNCIRDENEKVKSVIKSDFKTKFIYKLITSALFRI